jgi:hypothetical protein
MGHSLDNALPKSGCYELDSLNWVASQPLGLRRLKIVLPDSGFYDCVATVLVDDELVKASRIAKPLWVSSAAQITTFPCKIASPVVLAPGSIFNLHSATVEFSTSLSCKMMVNG